MGAVSNRVFEYLAVTTPVVVIGAPLGSLIGTHFHRLVLAALVYIIDTLALIGAFCIVPQTPTLAGVSVGIIVIGFLFFYMITRIGEKIMIGINEQEKKISGENPDEILCSQCEASIEVGVEIP